MAEFWESPDKTVSKQVIKAANFSKKPTHRATCHLVIENICVNNEQVKNLREKFRSEILDGNTEKITVIGDANAGIDRQIERALQMMMISEKSLITVLMPGEIIEKPICIQFEAVLVKFEPFKPIWEWTAEEKYNIALKYKETGVRLFKDERYVDAFHKFSVACKILITLEPIPDLELEKTLEDNINNLRLVLYNNMAGCQLNCKNFEHTISLCSKVLQKDENNVKALYRRGVAYGSLKNIEKAADDLRQAVSLEPLNHAAKKQYEIYNMKVQEANQRYDNMVRKMFKT